MTRLKSCRTGYPKMMIPMTDREQQQSHNHLSLQSPLIMWVIYFISHPNLGASNTNSTNFMSSNIVVSSEMMNTTIQSVSSTMKEGTLLTFSPRQNRFKGKYEGIARVWSFNHENCVLSLSIIMCKRKVLNIPPTTTPPRYGHESEEAIIIVCRMLKIWKSWNSLSHPLLFFHQLPLKCMPRRPCPSRHFSLPAREKGRPGIQVTFTYLSGDPS